MSNEEENYIDLMDEMLLDDNPKEKKKKKKKYKYTKGDVESTLVYLANTHKLKKSKGFKLKKYQKIKIYIYDQSVLVKLLNKFGFKDAGSIYDYKEFPLRDEIVTNSYSPLDFSLFNKLGISKENNSLVFYNKESWSIDCTFLIDIKKLKKFSKISSDVIMDDSQNYLEGVDFTCAEQSYFELSDSYTDDTRKYSVVRKKVPNENLVYDKNSTIYKVKNEILSFFTEKTEKIYNKLELPFKRGIILYGEPGNGKSAMIREIIRTSDKNIIKVIIKQVRNIVTALSTLINEMDGKKSIIIIEDIDSLINENNRSDLLNILDGVDVKSGMFLIATTNYPEKIDPAFMNRAGRFDKSYEIKNPNKETRRMFFESRSIDELLSGYKLNKNNKGTKDEIIDVFTENSKNLPLASLKELITSVSYMLVYNEEKYIEKAVKKVYKSMIEARQEHQKKFDENQMMERYNENNIPIQGTYGTIVNTGKKKAETEIIEEKHVIKIKKIK